MYEREGGAVRKKGREREERERERARLHSTYLWYTHHTIVTTAVYCLHFRESALVNSVC